MIYLYLLLGFVVLLLSGEVLVRGAVSLALKLKISVLVVGMTVVAFGTSAPELVVSLQAGLGGHPDVSIGNVVGSNIANIALVLGITVIIFPILIDKNSIKYDWPIMMLASVFFFVFIYNGVISKLEGIILLAGLVGFIIFSVQNSRKQITFGEPVPELEGGGKQYSIAVAILFVLVGCVGLVAGVYFFIDKGAIPIAENLGVSDHIISVTLVAFGTSVPELVTSVIAVFNKETDISVGNLIGSNIFNLLAILGITATVTDIPVNQMIIKQDVFWMLGSSFIIFPMMIYKKKLLRIFGIVLLAIYLGYFYFILS